MGEVGLNSLDGLTAHGNDSLLVSLSSSNQKASIEVQVLLTELNQFSDSKAGCIQHGQHGAVPQAEGGLLGGGIEKPVDFFVLQNFWKTPAEPRLSEEGCRTGCNALLGNQFLEQHPNRTEGSCNGAGALSLLGKSLKMLQEVTFPNFAGGRCPTGTVGGQGLHQFIQVPTVGLHRVVRELAFEAQGPQVVVNCLIHIPRIAQGRRMSNFPGGFALPRIDEKKSLLYRESRGGRNDYSGRGFRDHTGRIGAA